MAAAATPALAAQANRPPSTPPVNGRYRTGDDIDPMKDERSGLIREVGCQAIWSLSSCKPGFGVDQLRDQSLENYWQSDGQLPHLVNIQFRRKMTIRDICIYTDFKLDESYTPSKISIRCGTHFNDLQEVELVEFSEPSGWVQIFLKDIRDRPIRTFMLQLAVLSNHQNGRDTHLRQIRIHSPVDNLPVAVFPGNFTSLAYVSIWLHQLVKGFRDKDGNPLPNAHLLGVFHRVCKLLNYGIKPVFVFDGGIPALKRQTLAARRQKKIESLDKAEVARQKLLSAYLQQQLQRQAKIALPASMRMQAQIDAFSKSPSGSPRKRKAGAAGLSQIAGTDEDTVKDENNVDKDLEAFRDALIAKLEDDVDEVNAKNSLSDSEEDDEEDANGYRYGVDYSENFGIIQAPEFDTLPLETQHEILFEMQESRKMNSWGKFDQMPKDLQSFSNFQMDRLVKRRTLQKKIRSVQQEMGQRHIHVQNLDDLLKMDYNNFEDKETQITGSQGDGFVLIKTPPKGKEDKDEPKPGTSKATATAKPPDIITIDDFIEENSSDSDSNIREEGGSVGSKVNVKNIPFEGEDADLKLAIALSLKDVGQTETSLNTSHGKIKSSTSVKESVTSPQEINNTLQKSTVLSNKKNDEKEGQDDFSINMSHCAKFLDTVGFQLPKPQPKSTSENNDRNIISNSGISVGNSMEQESESLAVQNEGEQDSTSESDDDFEEVDDEKATHLPPMGQSAIVASVDLANITKSAPVDDDIFADIFLKSDQKNELSTRIAEGSSQSIETDIIDVPMSTSPSKCDFETKWDSDSDIEADLLEIVMKESAEVASNKDKQTSLTSNKSLSAKFAVSHAATNECSPVTVTEPQTAEETNATDKLEKQPESKIRMITADYMQAQQQLNNQLSKLHSEMGHQERIATSISDQMQIETQELISLFGIPYIVSPTEAESQCAFLDRACLTEGTITDDSDVWLFGGQRVYKNFFSQGQKHVELYQVADIQRVLNLSREKLIVLAIMIGSDYSDGIQGVGPVLALEILSEFTTPDLESFETLLKFREWWNEIQTKPQDLFSGSKLKEKLRKLKLRPGFPSTAVYDAFINPTIDTSTEAFKWGNPDLDAIRNYTKQKFGWEQSKCDSLLLPVLKKRQCELDQSRQLTLDSYISFGKMPTLDGGKRKKGSKRIQTAAKRLKRVGTKSGELNLSSESDSDAETEGTSESSTFQKQVTNRVGKGKKSALSSREKTVAKNKRQQESTESSPSNIQPSASSTTTTTSTNMNRLISPRKPEIIPQRVQSESDKLKNKQKAIEIFKLKKNKP